MDDATKMMHVISIILIILNTILVYFTEVLPVTDTPVLGDSGILSTLKNYFYEPTGATPADGGNTRGWLTSLGKIFMSLVIVVVLSFNQQTFNSPWIFVIALFVYIVISYSNLQRSHNLLLNDDTKECGYVIPKNKYYSDKFYELRIGYGFLIMVTALMICYRDIKGNCSEALSKILGIFSPMIMLVILLFISMITSQSFTKDRTGSAFDYVFTFFKGVNTGVATDTATVDDYRKFLGVDWGFHTADSEIRAAAATDIPAVVGGDTPATKLSRVQSRVYMKFILIAALFSFFVYSAVTSDVQCGVDLKSPLKNIVSKTPSYMIAFIVLSPFIIKNIMMNECAVSYSELSYEKEEITDVAGNANDNFTSAEEFNLGCLLDKMGGLEIYILLCLLCILMYAGKDTGFKLNIVLFCIVASVAFGFIMKPGSGETTGAGAGGTTPTPVGGTAPTNCSDWVTATGGMCPTAGTPSSCPALSGATPQQQATCTAVSQSEAACNSFTQSGTCDTFVPATPPGTALSSAPGTDPCDSESTCLTACCT